jgi:hypothetical protein
MNIREQSRRFRKKFLPLDDQSSWPFISGDTYLNLCDFTLSKKMVSEINGNFHKLILQKKHVFLPTDLVAQLAQHLQSKEIPPLLNWTLVIHNGDHSPSEDNMRILHANFADVYSVNWMGPSELASPIPIGLENWDYLRNGVPSDYLRESRKIQKFSNRGILLFSSFNLDTNIEERTRASEAIPKLSNILTTQKFIPPHKYRKVVRSSKFVLSPPGNGIDCHRTWEAIYLGAIPIVKKTYWPFNNYDLPVLVVNDWNEIGDSIANYQGTKSVTKEELNTLFLDFLFG